MTFEEAYVLGSDPVWRQRCQTGALRSAADVISEDEATPGHDLRSAYANRVMLNPLVEAGPIAFGVAAAPGITGPEATDQDLLFTINSLWNAWSGVA